MHLHPGAGGAGSTGVRGRSGSGGKWEAIIMTHQLIPVEAPPLESHTRIISIDLVLILLASSTDTGLLF